jgi:hypothetical protein
LKSLWAVPSDNFGGIHIFSIVITVVAIVTYIIVFNLNRLTSGLRGVYHQIRTPLVDRMSRDDSADDDRAPNSWAQRGRLFRGWEPGKKNKAPSEWLIVWYGVVCITLGIRDFRVKSAAMGIVRGLKKVIGKRT